MLGEMPTESANARYGNNQFAGGLGNRGGSEDPTVGMQLLGHLGVHVNRTDFCGRHTCESQGFSQGHPRSRHSSL